MEKILKNLINSKFKMINNSIYTLKNTMTDDIVGVYSIVGPNGRCYIGSSYGKRGVLSRIMTHRRSLVANKHDNPKLSKAWNKYGENGFTFEFIELYLRGNITKDLLREREQFYIDLMDGYTRGYNCKPLAVLPGYKSNLFTDDHKSKISKALKAAYQDDEHHSRVVEGIKNSWKTEARRKKQTEARKGKSLSEEHKKKLSEAKKGKKLSEEHKRSITNSLLQMRDVISQKSRDGWIKRNKVTEKQIEKPEKDDL